MRVNSISNKSFGQIYIDNFKLEYGLCLDIKNEKPREKKKVLAAINRNLNSDYIDIYVTSNAEVFIQDRIKKGKTYITGNVPLYHKFKTALAYAEIKEDRKEHIITL